MTRAFARSVSVVALAITLSLFAVPSASAGPLFSSPGIQDSRAGWLTTAWTWIGDILGLNYSSGVPKKPSQATENTEMIREIGHSGSCIDPLGIPLPEYLCTQKGSRREVTFKPKA